MIGLLLIALINSVPVRAADVSWWVRWCERNLVGWDFSDEIDHHRQSVPVDQWPVFFEKKYREIGGRLFWAKPPSRGEQWRLKAYGDMLRALNAGHEAIEAYGFLEAR